MSTAKNAASSISSDIRLTANPAEAAGAASCAVAAASCAAAAAAASAWAAAARERLTSKLILGESENEMLSSTIIRNSSCEAANLTSHSFCCV